LIESINMQNYSAEINRIVEFIKVHITKFNRNGAVLGFSGGLDSAVAASLTAQALGKEKVILVNLPERDSKPVHQKHAQEFALYLGCRFIKHSLTVPLIALGTYGLLPISFLPSKALRGRLVEYGRSKVLGDDSKELLITRFNSEDNSWQARGNAYSMAKHRLRMVWIYQYAETHNLMVVGAANKTEWMTGTFSKWGVDHCADIMPIMHLFRTQVLEMAKLINIPDYIISKPADPDILPGLPDKNILLGDFKTVDEILFGIEEKIPKKELIEKYNMDLVEKLIELVSLSENMRMSSYHLENKIIDNRS
jgi:NAD+ synthase